MYAHMFKHSYDCIQLSCIRLYRKFSFCNPLVI
nr:MAG TPA: hypothetical protein [Caudoviricetes sp.]